jgi:phosphogluconate dehydratase
VTQTNSQIIAVTENIIRRSKSLRAAYLNQLEQDRNNLPKREQLSCGNLAHGMAACDATDKQQLKIMDSGNMAIITAYNDMLSAHQPYRDYPEQLKLALRQMGCTGQVAGSVPAMCDGVTQGQTGMELSLLSRDLIAQCAAISLSHQMFDGVLALGICDKIVPGLLIGCLAFGYLPTIFVPAGPMESGLSNKEKQRTRERFARGEIDRDALLEAELASYHSPGTCTFYGTANSNQVILEALGMQLPGSSFINPDNPLRGELTAEAGRQLARISTRSNNYRPIGQIIDERAIVNAIVALLASGGSTNHSIHLIAIARAAGILITWDDIADLSQAVPLLCRVYPNGQADINHFHAAGGTGTLFNELLSAGFMHAEAMTVWGKNFSSFNQQAGLKDNKLVWHDAPASSHDPEVLASADAPFASEGGLRLLKGNLGKGIIKVSAVAEQHRIVEAPAVIIDSQDELKPLFESGALDRDSIIVVRFQGPRANGMPELHKLTPLLSSLQDKGYRVALVTDGRMSGASGKVPAVVHLVPEAAQGGSLAKLRNGDRLRVDALQGNLEYLGDMSELNNRPACSQSNPDPLGCGRELFSLNRANISSADQGASYLFASND